MKIGKRSKKLSRGMTVAIVLVVALSLSAIGAYAVILWNSHTMSGSDSAEIFGLDQEVSGISLDSVMLPYDETTSNVVFDDWSAISLGPGSSETTAAHTWENTHASSAYRITPDWSAILALTSAVGGPWEGVFFDVLSSGSPISEIILEPSESAPMEFSISVDSLFADPGAENPMPLELDYLIERGTLGVAGLGSYSYPFNGDLLDNIDSVDFEQTSGDPVTYEAGKFNDAIKLTSVDQDVYTADSVAGNLDMSGAWSIAFWYKLEATPSSTAPVLIKKDTITNGIGWGFAYSPSGTLALTIGDGAGNLLVPMAGVLTIDVWKHIAITYDGDGVTWGYEHMKIFMDGVDETATYPGNTGLSSPGLIATTDVIGLGSHPTGDGSIGMFDDVVIAPGTCFTPAEVTTLFTTENGGTGEFVPD